MRSDAAPEVAFGVRGLPHRAHLGQGCSLQTEVDDPQAGRGEAGDCVRLHAIDPRLASPRSHVQGAAANLGCQALRPAWIWKEERRLQVGMNVFRSVFIDEFVEQVGKCSGSAQVPSA